MTGNEIIALKDGKGFLIKVRHSGYDIVDFLKADKFDFNLAPRTTLLEYLSWRELQMTELSRGAELAETRNKAIFEFDFVGNSGAGDALDLADNGEAAIQHAEKLIAEDEELEGQWAGYLCGYSDYVVVLDFDQKVVAVNGEELLAYLKREEREAAQTQNSPVPSFARPSHPFGGDMSFFPNLSGHQEMSPADMMRVVSIFNHLSPEDRDELIAEAESRLDKTA